MKKILGLSLPWALAMAILPSPPVRADDSTPPLTRYALLWTNSPLTEAPEKESGPPAREPGITRNPGTTSEQEDDPQQGNRPPLHEWLLQNPPEPTTKAKATTGLAALGRLELTGNDLTLQRIKLHPSAPGQRYHRARVEIEVSGTEAALYRWLDRMHSPKAFRAVTFFRINPTRADDTLVQCLIIVEQLFLPTDAHRPKPAGDIPPELLPLVEKAHYPMELMLHLARSLPGPGVRFDRVEINNQIADDRLIRDVKIMGSSDRLKDLNAFASSLKKAGELNEYAWMIPLPTESKDGSWYFFYQALFKPDDESG